MKERCRKVKPDIEQKLNEEEWRSLIRLIDSLFPNVSVFMKEKKNDSCVRKEKFSKEKGAKK